MQGIKLNFKAKPVQIILALFILLSLLVAYALLRDSAKLITHKEANTLFNENKIQKIILDEPYVRFVTADGHYKIYKGAINKPAFFTKYRVEVSEKNESLYEMLSLVILVVAFILLYRFMQQSRLQQMRQIQSRVKAEEPQGYNPVEAISSNITFDDVAGIKDVKEELEEIIDFLKAPQKYRDFDIRLPKGVLLIGPPGVGKTLIAKAVAGEAGVPFFYQSGASFVHIYVGMGAKRVSELFKKAKQMAPSIIFIDEIDAVGKSRGEFRNDEREATLNQLLTEMDGFEESSGVIVIGATNKVDVLDEALLRAGRFDRRVHISLPDLEERAKTLELYLAKKENTVNIQKVAQMTVGFNSAALATLTNEAALYVLKTGRTSVKTADFEMVKEKVLLGKHKILSFTEEERNIQAVYQGAKALIATWFDIEFEKIGIVTTRLLEQDHEILSKNHILNRIKVYLAGSVATQMIFKEQFTNASSDIQKAKQLAHQLIYEYAMGEHFVVSPTEEEMLLQQAQTDVKSLLEKLQEAREKMTEHILTHENITNEEAREILRGIF